MGADWFEWRNFGTLYQGQQDDSDEDGFTNGQEDALGQEPTIFDEVEDGAYRPGGQPLCLCRYQHGKIHEDDPLGFVETTDGIWKSTGPPLPPTCMGRATGIPLPTGR